MSENQQFDVVMRNIAAGLTDDPQENFRYLMEQCQKYKDHEFGSEIIRACGRMLYESAPEEKKTEIDKISQNFMQGTKAALDEIRFNIYKKDFKKALKLAEDLVKGEEETSQFKDDKVSEYRLFDETFEELLYRYRYEPTKDLRQSPIPYTEMYALYGSLLVEAGQLEEARVALQKGLRWNPIHFDLTIEYIETFKMEGRLEEFFEKTIEAFDIVFRPKDLARLYRNLGYYFVEKKMFREAVALYLLSLMYDKESRQAQSELYYISQEGGEQATAPSGDELRIIAEKYNFPAGPKEEIAGLAYNYGMHFFEEGNYEPAEYFLTIFDNITLARHEEVEAALAAIKEARKE